MLDAHIIDYLKRLREEKRRQREESARIPLQLPLLEEEPEEEKDDNGVIIIDIEDGYKVINFYQ